jgi:hypothetical protein
LVEGEWPLGQLLAERLALHELHGEHLPIVGLFQ